MRAFSIDTDYLEMLILKMRAVLENEDENASAPDDDMDRDEDPSTPPDLSREEVIEEIQGLSTEQQDDLVALMWLGRGDDDAENWCELVAEAEDRRTIPTEDYLLGHARVADYLAEGLALLDREANRA